MRLIYGLIFGTGLGLLTAGATGLAEDHTLSLYIIGALLISAEISRALISKTQ